MNKTLNVSTSLKSQLQHLNLNKSVQEGSGGKGSVGLKLTSFPVFIAISPKPCNPPQTQEYIAGIRFLLWARRSGVLWTLACDEQANGFSLSEGWVTWVIPFLNSRTGFMLQAASASQRGINFRLKPCVSCHCRLLLPFSPAVTMCQWITMGRGTMPRVGIIKTSKVYVVRSQTTTRKMGAPLLPSNVRETKIEAGLSGAFGQTGHRFPLCKVPLGGEREIYI